MPFNPGRHRPFPSQSGRSRRITIDESRPPIILGAGVWKMRELLGGEAGAFDPLVLAAGMLAAALSGLLAIGGLLWFLRRFSTDVFGVYRIGFAIVAAALLLSR